MYSKIYTMSVYCIAPYNELVYPIKNGNIWDLWGCNFLEISIRCWSNNNCLSISLFKNLLYLWTFNTNRVSIYVTDKGTISAYFSFYKSDFTDYFAY